MRSLNSSLLAGILIVATLAFGYWVYQDQNQPPGVEIIVGTRGVSVQSR